MSVPLFMQPVDPKDTSHRLAQSWRDSIFTCAFVFFAGWVSGSGSISLWITLPAVLSISILEAGLMRRRLAALIAAKERMKDTYGLINEDHESVELP